MRIGIVGTGHVGSALATGLADGGHSVMLGSRDPAQTRLIEWVAEDPSSRQVDNARTAVLFGDLVVMTVPGRLLPDTIDEIGRDAFAGKIVVDVTNPIAHNEQGQTVDAFGEDDSGAEFLQRELPDSYVVKALNQISAPDMLRPDRSAIDRVRIAGDDDEAKRRVTELLGSFGWKVRDLGALSRARVLEHGVIQHFGGA